MGPQAATEPVQRELQVPQWSLATRVAFRFCFVYFGLFCVCSTLGGLFPVPRVDDTMGVGTFWPMREVTFWTAVHIFGAKLPLIYRGSGSDDKIFDWVLSFCLLVFAVLATCIWTALDRKRENYVTVHKWFRLFIRFVLASELLYFGISKVIPNQMLLPSLLALLRPLGSFSRYGILWLSVGAAPAYEVFAGCAEVLGGLLLIVPRTATFGALVCLADMIQVFMLNMTYDVDVKLFSFHLGLLALLLLAPDVPRLVNVFFVNRAAEPSTHPQLFRTRRANRTALAVQILIGIWLVGMNAYGGLKAWYTWGGGRPKSPLYGIWEVSQMSVDGQLRPPLLTDRDRWRRVIFDSGFDSPTLMVFQRIVFQRIDDSFVGYRASININDQSLVLTKGSDKNREANFTFQRTAQDQLTLDGEMDSHKIHMQLQLTDRNKLPLVSSGFHWVQEH